MASPLERKDESAERAYDRVTILVAGTLWANGAPRDVRVRNISAGGAMVELERAPRPGTPVTLQSAKTGTVDGTIAWAREGRCGIQFDALIDIDLAPRPVASAPVPVPVETYRRPGLRQRLDANAARPEDWY